MIEKNLTTNNEKLTALALYWQEKLNVDIRKKLNLNHVDVYGDYRCLYEYYFDLNFTDYAFEKMYTPAIDPTDCGFTVYRYDKLDENAKYVKIFVRYFAAMSGRSMLHIMKYSDELLNNIQKLEKTEINKLIVSEFIEILEKSRQRLLNFKFRHLIMKRIEKYNEKLAESLIEKM